MVKLKMKSDTTRKRNNLKADNVWTNSRVSSYTPQAPKYYMQMNISSDYN